MDESGVAPICLVDTFDTLKHGVQFRRRLSGSQPSSSKFLSEQGYDSWKDKCNVVATHSYYDARQLIHQYFFRVNKIGKRISSFRLIQDWRTLWESTEMLECQWEGDSCFVKVEMRLLSLKLSNWPASTELSVKIWENDCGRSEDHGGDRRVFDGAFAVRLFMGCLYGDKNDVAASVSRSCHSLTLSS